MDVEQIITEVTEKKDNWSNSDAWSLMNYPPEAEAIALTECLGYY